MAKTLKQFITLFPVLIIAIALQGIFIIVDQHDRPNAAAAEFSKAYFQLNECKMAKYVCNELKENGAIGDYLHQVASQAAARGFKTSYLKNRISHIQTEVTKTDGTNAEVTLTAKKIKSINPVFELVGRIFCLILLIVLFISYDTHAQDSELNEVLALMKTVEEKILELENRQQEDIHVKIGQLETEIDGIRNETKNNNVVFGDFTTEIQWLYFSSPG